MEQFFRQQHEFGEEAAIVEAVYHATKWDPDRGLEEWIKVFEAAFQRSRYDLCRSLRDILDELPITSSLLRGIISFHEARFLQQFALYAEARAEYSEAITALDESL